MLKDKTSPSLGSLFRFNGKCFAQACLCDFFRDYQTHYYYYCCCCCCLFLWKVLCTSIPQKLWFLQINMLIFLLASSSSLFFIINAHITNATNQLSNRSGYWFILGAFGDKSLNISLYCLRFTIFFHSDRSFSQILRPKISNLLFLQNHIP